MSVWERVQAVLGGPQPESVDDGERLRLAAAVLLVEIARADFEHDPAEAKAVERALRAHFGLPEDEVAELVGMAHRERDSAVSFDQHLRVINDALDAGAKRRLLHFLWEVAYADGQLHHYEEHLLRRISELLHLSHGDYIQAKLAVSEGAG